MIVGRRHRAAGGGEGKLEGGEEHGEDRLELHKGKLLAQAGVEPAAVCFFGGERLVGTCVICFNERNGGLKPQSKQGAYMYMCVYLLTRRGRKRRAGGAPPAGARSCGYSV